MNKIKVGVIFGSRSAEHDVSIVTAIASIIKPLNLSQEYETVPIYITKQGQWYCDPKLADINLYTKDQINSFVSKLQPLCLELGGGFKIIKNGLKTKKIRLDVIFPATHGTHGEDGELMGLLELLDVPYVGADMPSSVLSMDKALAKTILKASNIPTPSFVNFYSKDFIKDPKKIMVMISSLNYPLFVKPVHLGSSIAISRVNKSSELGNAIELAMHYDNKIIVEEAVNNLVEVTVPIIGNDNPKTALVEQPLLKDEAFFDFNTKYISSKSKGKSPKKGGSQGYSKIPADLPLDLYRQSESVALQSYKALGLSGIARIDLLIDYKTKTVYFNEVNPMPGSLYSHNWNLSGLSNVDLVKELIRLAFERYDQKKQINTVFSTNYLKQY